MFPSLLYLNQQLYFVAFESSRDFHVKLHGKPLNTILPYSQKVTKSGLGKRHSE